MDPNEALTTLRAMAQEQTDAPGFDSQQDALAFVETFTETFIALDEWISRDGFPPAAWVQEDQRGCSCGMADYGAPGHEGHQETN